MAVEEEPAPGIPEWVVTFGDMMSLLLTFFIMLVSMSEMKEEEKFQAMVESFRQQFGAHETSRESMVPGDSRNRGSQSPHPIYSMGRSQKKDIKNGGQEVKAVVGDNEKVQIVRPGDDSSIGGVIYFDEDATELTDDNKRDLVRIIEQLAGKPQKIEIRGHTSRRPVDPKSGIQDLWDLADRRSHHVMNFLIEQGIEPNRIRLGNAESHEPLYNGVDPDRLKKNSRVQILMWDERVSDLDGSLKPIVVESSVL